MQPVRIGLDVAKNVFQVHGVDVEDNIVLRRKLRRAEVISFFAELPHCLVGVEACSASHHWARELTQLGPALSRVQRPTGRRSASACRSGRRRQKARTR